MSDTSQELAAALDSLGLTKDPIVHWSKNTNRSLSYREPTKTHHHTTRSRSISHGGFRVDSAPTTPVRQTSGSRSHMGDSKYTSKFDYGIMGSQNDDEYQSPTVPSPLPDQEMLPRCLMLAMSEVAVRDAYDEAIDSGYFNLTNKKTYWKVSLGITICVVCAGIVLFWYYKDVDHWLLLAFWNCRLVEGYLV